MFHDPLFYRFSIEKKYVESMAKAGRKVNVVIFPRRWTKKSIQLFSIGALDFPMDDDRQHDPQDDDG